MANINLNAIEFSDDDLKKINEALIMLEEAFAGKLINDETAKNGALYEIEDITTIPHDETTLMLHAIPAFANLSIWNNNEKTREQLNPIAKRLKDIAKQVVLTNRAVLQRCWNSTSKY